MYVLSTGCQWRAIPKDLPPKSTEYGYFDLWTYDGTLQRIHHALYEQCREQAQREASARTIGLAEQAILNFENSPRTKFANQLQTRGGGTNTTEKDVESR